jgi:hypothetical protein
MGAGGAVPYLRLSITARPIAARRHEEGRSRVIATLAWSPGTIGAAALHLPSFRDVARRALPQVIEAVIVPAAILMLVTTIATTTVAIGAALAWALGALAWRWVIRRRVPVITILAVARLLARSVIAVAAGSTFLYFLQPVIGGFCLATAFLVSVIIDRPLARRFAGDFGLPRHASYDGRFLHVFRRISLMWGVVGIANAAAGLWLLVTQSTHVYVLASTVLSIAVPATAAWASIVWFGRTVARTSKIGVPTHNG